MSAQAVVIKRGDRLPAVRATLRWTDGTPIDLTGATVRFLMADLRGQRKVDAPATIVDAAAGLVEYAWQASDTDMPGTYRAEFEVQFASGLKVTVPNDGYITVTIMPDLG